MLNFIIIIIQVSYTAINTSDNIKPSQTQL